jgi:protein-disulfide isomerase
MTHRPIARWRDFSRSTRGAPVLILIASMTGFVPPLHAANGADSSPSQNIIGTVGQAQVSETDIIAAYKTEFDGLQDSYERQLHQLELKFAKSRHDLLQQHLDKLLDRDALEMEAKARGVAPDKIAPKLDAALPTEEDARAFYDANKDRIKQPYEEVAPKVRQYLATQRNQAATRSFYDELRAKYKISSTLAPYRVPVTATGPVRGQSTARVTIVEFGDFQCPYCKEAESSLRTVMARHPQDVRVVFRNLPLTQIHPNAQIAAEAAVCADRQGKFWEMHDAMYDDQSALSSEALKSTAARLGLQTDRFSACLGDVSTTRSLDVDAKAAQELGLEGTPYFFINGRPIDGDVPAEKLESVIADELHRAPGERG